MHRIAYIKSLFDILQIIIGFLDEIILFYTPQNIQRMALCTGNYFKNLIFLPLVPCGIFSRQRNRFIRRQRDKNAFRRPNKKMISRVENFCFVAHRPRRNVYERCDLLLSPPRFLAQRYHALRNGQKPFYSPKSRIPQ